MKTGAPVVVVGGSGRAASLLEAICQRLEEQPTLSGQSLQKEITELTKQFLKIASVDDKTIAMINECLQFLSQIKIFQLDSDENTTSSDLDKAVLSTLLSTGKLTVSCVASVSRSSKLDNPGRLKIVTNFGNFPKLVFLVAFYQIFRISC